MFFSFACSREIYTPVRLIFLVVVALLVTRATAQVTRLNTDTLKIRSGSTTKIIIPGESSASISFPASDGVLAIEQGESVFPVGSVSYVLNTASVPDGYVRADGQALSRTDYAALFDKIGTTYGAGNGTTTFNVPTIIDPYVPRSNLIGWWPFSGDANDRWFQSNHATVYGATLTTDRYDRSNAAYDFDGINDYMLVNNTCFNNGWNEWSISLWVRLVNPPNAINVFFNTSPHTAVGLSAGTGPTYKVGVGNAVGTWVYLDPNLAPTNSNYVTNEWQQICVVRSGLNLKFYINGVVDKQYTLSGAPADAYCKLYFGKCDCGPGEYAKAKIDDIGIWSRALTQDEVTALYRAAHYAVIRWKQ